jgi:hypothetical protein
MTAQRQMHRVALKLRIMKRKLISKGDQFHQYQQNEQVHFILAKLADHKKKTTTYDVGNLSSGLGQADKWRIAQAKDSLVSLVYLLA